MIKYHPILFSTSMVQGLLEDSKTKTRRTKGLEKVNLNPNDWKFEAFGTNPDKENDKNLHAYFTVKGTETWMHLKCPCNVGDVLWVRETFTEWPKGDFQYFVNTAMGEELGKWKPSIHMPKEACRIFLKIKSIRVERLQDISEEDAIAEGAKDRLRHSDLKVLDGLGNWKIPSPFLEHQFGFLAIWCTINGCDNWIFNPFVWVYEFEKIEKPLDFI